MTTLYWPVAAIGRPAAPVRDGYAVAHARPVLTRRWPLSVSQVQYARSAPAALDVTFAMHDADIAYALGWLVHEAAWGTQWFWMPIKAAGVVEVKEVQVVGESITEALRGPKHGRLSLSVLTRRMMPMSLPQWETMLPFGGPRGYYEWLQALNKTVNTE